MYEYIHNAADYKALGYIYHSWGFLKNISVVNQIFNSNDWKVSLLQDC